MQSAHGSWRRVGFAVRISPLPLAIECLQRVPRLQVGPAMRRVAFPVGRLIINATNILGLELELILCRSMHKRPTLGHGEGSTVQRVAELV